MGRADLNIVMIRCPNTGREISRGIEMDVATFEQLPDIRSQLMRPVCRFNHVWSTREAWLDNPPPSLPEIAWLMLNNRVAENNWVSTARRAGMSFDSGRKCNRYKPRLLP